MRIDENLNLVLPVVSDDEGTKVYGFHTPISREVFEANYRIIAATKAELSSKGIHYQIGTGPQIATLTLKDAGREYAIASGDIDDKGEPGDGGVLALLADIKRLTMILAPGANGWEMIPVETAIAQEVIDEEDWEEAESELVFFTCHFATTRKKDRNKVATATASILGGSCTSSNISEYAASLSPLKKVSNSRKAVSSVPS